jgi:hypothetical protein
LAQGTWRVAREQGNVAGTVPSSLVSPGAAARCPVPLKPPSLKFRLSLLMFLQYAVPGAWLPVLSVRLQEMGFTPVAIGLVCACSALAALAAPLIAGQVADRWVSSERCIGGCSLLAGLLLWLLPELEQPFAVFCCCLAFWMVMTPAITLGNSMSFTHLRRPERHFGRIRLWGTVGWVVPNLVLGWWLAGPDRTLADCQRLGSLLAFVLAAYSLTLPHTPPARQGVAWLAPLAALQLLRERTFATYALCSVGLCVTLSFGQQVMPLLLVHLGVGAAWLCPTLTLSQSMEIASLAVLPWLLARFGARGTMLLGLCVWAAALSILTAHQPLWLVVGTLGAYGLCYACFVVAGQVFTNGRAGPDFRASAQGLVTFLNGLGLLIGNVLVGWVRELVEGDFPLTFTAAVAVVVPLILIFLVGFEGVRPAPAAAKAAA